MASRQNTTEHSTFSSIVCSVIMCVIVFALMCGISAITKRQMSLERTRAQEEVALQAQHQ